MLSYRGYDSRRPMDLSERSVAPRSTQAYAHSRASSTMDESLPSSRASSPRAAVTTVEDGFDVIGACDSDASDGSADDTTTDASSAASSSRHGSAGAVTPRSATGSRQGSPLSRAASPFLAAVPAEGAAPELASRTASTRAGRPQAPWAPLPEPQDSPAEALATLNESLETLRAEPTQASDGPQRAAQAGPWLPRWPRSSAGTLLAVGTGVGTALGIGLSVAAYASRESWYVPAQAWLQPHLHAAAELWARHQDGLAGYRHALANGHPNQALQCAYNVFMCPQNKQETLASNPWWPDIQLPFVVPQP